MISISPDDNRSRLLVHAYVDGELDPVNAIAIEQQIAADPALAAEAAHTQALRRALREKLPALDVPAGLEARVQSAVGITRTGHAPSWRAMAASIMLAIVASSSATWFFARNAATDDVLEAVVGGHLRALIAPQPIDVASSDGHTVKPWFNGRIPQAPQVVDLSQSGFNLVGGRVDVVERTGVPTLVYQIRQHLISLTAIPDSAPTSGAPTVTAVRGYNVVRWTVGDVAYVAVSDLNVADLTKFALAFRAPPGSPRNDTSR
jgi:anti-sigma factor RsiW